MQSRNSSDEMAPMTLEKSEQDQKKQEPSFSSGIKFGGGFWENLSSYEKKWRQEIESNELFTPFIKNDLLENLSQTLEAEVSQAKIVLNKTKEVELVKNKIEDIISRRDISVDDKIQATFYNQNEPNCQKFYVFCDLQSSKSTAVTLLPNLSFLQQEKLRQESEALKAQISYPLGLALDPQYIIKSPRLKLIYSKINQNATFDFIRFGPRTDISNEQTELKAQEIYTSFGKSAIFIRGGYFIFQDIQDTFFRLRGYDYVSPTLHLTYDRTPFKYFTYSPSCYWRK